VIAGLTRMRSSLRSVGSGDSFVTLPGARSGKQLVTKNTGDYVETIIDLPASP
jgi:hypothetical protein